MLDYKSLKDLTENNIKTFSMQYESIHGFVKILENTYIDYFAHSETEAKEDIKIFLKKIIDTLNNIKGSLDLLQGAPKV